MNPAVNFVDALHNESFEDRYLSKRITHQSMIYDHGREKESLNGNWHFGIDQYDTCLRADWYKESYEDSEGRTNPMDFSFDEWETMTVPSCWNTQGRSIFTMKEAWCTPGHSSTATEGRSGCSSNSVQSITMRKSFESGISRLP